MKRSLIVSVCLLSLAAGCRPSPFVHAKGRGLSVDGAPFVLRGVTLMDDATLWEAAKTEPDLASIEERDYALSALGGINVVRLAVKMDYVVDADGQPRPEGFAFLDRELARAKRHGLRLLLDLHVPPGGAVQDYRRDDGAQSFWRDAALGERLVSGWRRIAERYRDETAVLGFELLNEPAGDPDAYWQLMKRTIRGIREVDRHHLIVLQPDREGEVRRIRDVNVAIAFHFYDPPGFTLQNVFWEKAYASAAPVRYPGEAEGWDGQRRFFDRQALEASMRRWAVLSRRLRMPVFLGEFGVSTAADEGSAARWLADVVELVAELRLDGFVAWRQIGHGVAALAPRGEATMAAIDREGFFSPAQFYGIRPGLAAQMPPAEIVKAYGAAGSERTERP